MLQRVHFGLPRRGNGGRVAASRAGWGRWRACRFGLAALGGRGLAATWLSDAARETPFPRNCRVTQQLRYTCVFTWAQGSARLLAKLLMQIGL